MKKEGSIPDWMYHRSRKKCPVCYIFKTYEGPICRACVAVGFKVQPDGKIRRDRPDLLKKG